MIVALINLVIPSFFVLVSTLLVYVESAVALDNIFVLFFMAILNIGINYDTNSFNRD